MMTHTFWILDKCQPLCVSGFHRVFTCSQHFGSAGKPLPCAGDPWIEIAELHVAMQRHLRAAAAVLLWLCLAQIMLSWRNWVWTSASSASSAICLIHVDLLLLRDLSSVWWHIAVSSPTLGNHGNPWPLQNVGHRIGARCVVGDDCVEQIEELLELQGTGCGSELGNLCPLFSIPVIWEKGREHDEHVSMFFVCFWYIIWSILNLVGWQMVQQALILHIYIDQFKSLKALKK